MVTSLRMRCERICLYLPIPPCISLYLPISRDQLEDAVREDLLPRAVVAQSHLDARPPLVGDLAQRGLREGRVRVRVRVRVRIGLGLGLGLGLALGLGLGFGVGFGFGLGFGVGLG